MALPPSSRVNASTSSRKARNIETPDGSWSPAVIADDVHRNAAGAAGAVEVLRQALVSAFRLLVVVGTDEAIEDLTDRQRQMRGVFVEHAPHLIEQCERGLFGRPGREATHAGTYPLHAAEQMLRGRRGGRGAALHRAGSGSAGPGGNGFWRVSRHWSKVGGRPASKIAWQAAGQPFPRMQRSRIARVEPTNEMACHCPVRFDDRR